MAVNGANYIPITIDNTQVSSDLTDFVVYISLNDVNVAGFWSKVKSDGGDVRFTKDDGSTELAFEIVSIDTTAETGEIHVKFSGTLSSSSDTEIRMYYNSSDSAYAVTDTFGRNAVWADYGFVLHFTEEAGNYIDSAGNYEFIVNGTPTRGVSTPLGNGITFTQGQAGDYLIANGNVPVNESHHFSFFANWANQLDSYAFLTTDDFNVDYLYIYTSNTEDLRYFTPSTSNVEVLSDFPDGSHAHYVIGHSTADYLGYIDGVNDETNTDDFYSGADPVVNDPIRIGAASNRDAAGLTIAELRLRNEAPDADWASAEQVNMNSPTTFYTVGTEQSAGGGTTIEIENGSFSLTGYDLFQNLSTPLDNGSFSVSGYDLFANQTLSLDTGAFSVDGKTLSFNSSIPLNKGTFALGGYGLFVNRSIPLDKGSLTVNGYPVSFNPIISLDDGSFSVTGYELLFDEGNTIILDKGSFTVDGKALSFNRNVPIDNSSFSLSGKDVGFKVGVPLASQSFNVTGYDLSTNTFVPIGNGSFIVTGYELIFDEVENLVILQLTSTITSEISLSSTISDIEGESTISDINEKSTF